MNFAAIRTWFGQSTNIQGISLAVMTLVSNIAGHPPTWATYTAAIGAAILVLFPQSHSAVSAAQPVITDVGKVIESYRLGVAHGQTAVQSAVNTVPNIVPLTSDVSTLVAAIKELIVTTAPQPPATSTPAPAIGPGSVVTVTQTAIPVATPTTATTTPPPVTTGGA